MKDETTMSLIENIEHIKKNGINCQATFYGFKLNCGKCWKKTWKAICI